MCVVLGILYSRHKPHAENDTEICSEPKLALTEPDISACWYICPIQVNMKLTIIHNIANSIC